MAGVTETISPSPPPRIASRQSLNPREARSRKPPKRFPFRAPDSTPLCGYDARDSHFGAPRCRVKLERRPAPWFEVASQADGEQIPVSSLKALVESSGEFEFGEAQEVELKGLAESHQVFDARWRKKMADSSQASLR